MRMVAAAMIPNDEMLMTYAIGKSCSDLTRLRGSVRRSVEEGLKLRKLSGVRIALVLVRDGVPLVATMRKVLAL